ncbi:PREDICTED: disease resistance protein RGA2 [Theobroma cacao]|uniref:Disease resistance protein RGA2 n=1 Tax=Theobroma cacao TaxID=3641 RepID=A0AB32WMC2_THECC|nr:PREDICTED: disease resistance protein RGA2 [Theobroma cacao]
MAESILFGALSNIFSKLMWLAGQKIGLIFWQKGELDKLQKTLDIIKAVILDAEEKQESNLVVKNWISRLEDIVSDAEDLLDEFDYEILRQKVRPRGQVRKIFRSFRMGPRVKEIRERLDVVAREIKTFDFNVRVVELDKKRKNTDRETASKVRPELVIGREEDKEHIIELLKEQNHGDSNFNIIAIVGFGGLGKTSLARLVYNDAQVADSFKGIWVCVSEEFNVLIIFKKILKCLGEHKVDDWNLNEVQKEIEQKLKGKRYLLVLDDVWNEDILKWNDFSQYMVFGAPGSKIIVTTRSTKVAATMGVHSPFLLKGLNEEQSQDLFEKVAFEGRQIDPKLGQIGKVVAQKCKGVPLSIKCLGGLMRQKPDEKYWLFVQENEIWNNDDVLSVLRLSYIQLPSNLKQCFAFCSLFSKDSRIYKDELIHFWRAQGYIQLGNKNENVQDIGDEYFNDLLSRSFFQEERKDANGNIIYCKMHDLIHDLALFVAGRYFHWMKNKREKISKGVRHVSLEKYFTVVFTRSKAKVIRTLFLRADIFMDLFNRKVTFSIFNCLRMLNLNLMNINILPDSIGELKHLRYLDLSRNTRMKVLPDAIVKLHHLQTLLLNGCSSLKKLPRDIRQLISLEYLKIDYCKDLSGLPKGLGELTSLQRLDRFVVNCVEDNLSTAATLNELSNLDLGNCLKIDHLHNVRNVELECKEANLKKKKRLQSLQLSWESSSPTTVASEKDESLLNILEPHPNLKGLKVSGYGGARFSSWLSSLTNLVELDINKFWNCRDLPPLDHFSSLKSLSLYRSNALKHLPPLDHLSSLESLSLGELDALEYVADSFSLPCSTSREPFFPSLKKLSIYNCPNLKGWWKTKNENQGSIAELPCFPCLFRLKVQNSGNLTSMPLFPSLDQDLTLEGTSIRPFQQTLKMKMTEASMRSEEASSSSGSTCHSYSSTALPLSNLKHLTLFKIKDLEALPKEFLQNLASLTFVRLKDCPKLESLPSQKMSCLTSLQDLLVENCSNLRALPDWILNLTSLETLQIWNCLELQHMPRGTHQLTSLKKLSVENCPNLRALPDWILKLTSLKTLQIWKCLELQYMPEGTPRLTSLEKLYVDCHNLRAFPDWILNLTSLKDLYICECLQSPYLQEGMQSLTSLERLMVDYCPNLSSSTHSLKALLIRGCPDLSFWRTRHSLSTLEELNVQNCPNLEDLLNRISFFIPPLKTLKICKCPQLQDLPERIDGLTSLQVLSICECPRLSKRCEKETGVLWPRIARIPSIIIDGRQIQ